MNKEKQIEEMAIIISLSIQKWANDLPPISCPVYNAENLYAAGYRKQSEGEWLFDDGMDRYCSNCGANALTNCFEYKQICTPYCPMCGAKMMFKPKGGEDCE